jgi:Uma2 family endonuclease
MAAPESTNLSAIEQEPIVRETAVEAGLEPDFKALEAFTRQLPDDDGEPLESPWHFAGIHLMIETLNFLLRERTDFFCGGNMFLYYSLKHVRNEDFKGPDFFFAWGVDRFRHRRFWVVWEEDGKYPDLIIEYESSKTARIDRTVKKTLYEQTFRTPEYYIYDPDQHRLEGWHLVDEKYHPLIPNEQGWLWSNVLQLWFGNWTGDYAGQSRTWLRCYDSKGHLVLIRAEAEQQKAEAEHLRAEAEKQRAEAERQRAEAAKQLAEAERQRAEAAKQLAEAAEAELARLKALLAEKGQVVETSEEPK